MSTRMEFPEWPEGPFERSARRLSWFRVGANASIALYLAGVLILIGGLIAGAALLGMPGESIAVSGIVVLGVLVLTGVAMTRLKDPD